MSRLMTKPTKWHVQPAKTRISLGIRPVWSECSLSMWRKFGFLATHWAQSKDSDQTGQMPRLIWVFAGCSVILLVLLWGGSNNACQSYIAQDIDWLLATTSSSAFELAHMKRVFYHIGEQWRLRPGAQVHPLSLARAFAICSHSIGNWRKEPGSFKPPHDKTNNVVVRWAKTQISLGIRPVWSESSLAACRKLGSLATHWAHS